MSTIHSELLDDELVPEEAVKGLDEATRRAREAGRPIVVVRQGKLVRVEGDQVAILKELPARRKVGGRRKAAGA